MAAHYKQSIILIEFGEDRSFSMQAISGAKFDENDIQGKLILLNLAIPNVRYIWSSSAYATADIFEDLKVVSV